MDKRLLFLLVVFVPGCGRGGGGGGGGGGTGPAADVSFHFDKGFDSTYTFTSSIHAAAAALDGSNDVYLAGSFNTFVDVTRRGLIRLNADGSVDAGLVTGSGFNNSANALAPDGSGDVYVGGAFTSYNGTAANRLVRLNVDGTADAGFAIGTGFNSTVRAIALAADGSGDLYAGGDFTTYDGTTVNRIVRLNSDGSIDAGFATGTAFTGASTPMALATVADGDVYVGGFLSIYNGAAITHAVRLNGDGSLDAGFATGTGFNNEVRAIALDASGDVYVGGMFFNYNGTAINRIARLDPTGTLDAGFAVGAGANWPVVVIQTATDGSNDVYVGGEFTSYNGAAGTSRLVRCNSDGSVDAGFALGTGFGGGPIPWIQVRAIALPADGSGDVCLGGYFYTYDGTAVDHFVRLNADATLDASTRLGSGFSASVQAVVPDGTGDLYVGGDFQWVRGAGRNRLARLNADGTLDAGFNIGTGFNQPVHSLAMAADGSGALYVGGPFGVYNGSAVSGLVRLLPTGALDPSFAIGAGINLDVRAIVPLAGGDVYVGGTFTQVDGTPMNRIARLNADGSIDGGFAIGTGFDGDVNALAEALDGSGDLFVAGNFGTYDATASLRMVRLNSDGTVDGGFSIGTGFNGVVEALAAVASGDVYVGGSFTACNGTASARIVRLNGDGSVDGGFFVVSGFNAVVDSLVVMPSGRLVVGGLFTTYSGSPSPGLAAVNGDGSFDGSFAVGDGCARRVLTMAADGADLYVGGDFTAYGSTTVDYLVAVNEDGTMD